MAGIDVLVLNLGADKQFKHAVRHVTGVVQSIAVTNRTADVQVATSRSRARIAELLGEPIGLLHVMGHGTPSGELHAGGRLFRLPKVYSLDELRAGLTPLGNAHVECLCWTPATRTPPGGWPASPR